MPASDVAADLPSWAERAVDRSMQVRRSRSRAVDQARTIIEAAERVVRAKGESFTTQEVIKEANIALQTLYRHFGGKDELQLAVLENMIARTARQFQASADGITDPVERLRYYVRQPILALYQERGAALFLAAERWQLQRRFPEEMKRARRPFADLLEREIIAAREQGLLQPPTDPGSDAWMIAELITAIYYDHATADVEDSYETIADRMWAFCLSALGGRRR